MRDGPGVVVAWQCVRRTIGLGAVTVIPGSAGWARSVLGDGAMAHRASEQPSRSAEVECSYHWIVIVRILIGATGSFWLTNSESACRQSR